MTAGVNNDPRGRWPGRILGWLGIAFAIFILFLAFELLNNNYSFRHQSRAAFNAQLDRELDTATNWIKANPFVSERNPAMMYMIADMEKMSHDPRLQGVLDDYQNHFLAHPSDLFELVWLRLGNPSAQIPVIHVPDMGDNPVDFVWYGHALAPDRILLSAGDRANLFSATKYSWGTRQKQLMALAIYREINGNSPELDNALNYVAEKVARDGHYDFRVGDSSIQRTAFILAAHRPDLIRPRWVETILESQNTDGTWYACWYGWCRGVLEFNPNYKTDIGGLNHATVQAAWALTMLKYRFPQWIDEHYH